jgi:hypothetical protein
MGKSLAMLLHVADLHYQCVSQKVIAVGTLERAFLSDVFACMCTVHEALTRMLQAGVLQVAHYEWQQCRVQAMV